LSGGGRRALTENEPRTWSWDKYVEAREREAVEAGRVEGREEIARGALLKGLSPEMVSEITGLDPDTLQRLKADSGSSRQNARL
jgi:predicted transposase YdaD